MLTNCQSNALSWFKPFSKMPHTVSKICIAMLMKYTKTDSNFSSRYDAKYIKKRQRDMTSTFLESFFLIAYVFSLFLKSKFYLLYT